MEDVRAEVALNGGDAAGALAAHGADLGAIVGVEVVLPLVGPLPAEGQRLVRVQLGRQLELLCICNLQFLRLNKMSQLCIKWLKD